MIPEPHPYDPDDPTDELDDAGYLLPDYAQRSARIDPIDPVEY
jgi:hypothetical protein